MTGFFDLLPIAIFSIIFASFTKDIFQPPSPPEPEPQKLIITPPKNATVEIVTDQ